MLRSLARFHISSPALADSRPTLLRRFGSADWNALSLLLLWACFVRVVFFTGLMGSDDVTYAEEALGILHGQWSASNYIGALRYGVNLPMAGFMALFGMSEFTANLWALSCSLAEIAVVFVFARHLWGLRAAAMSSLILGLLPLHVNLSGRLMADTPLALFVTLCFVLFYFAERYRSPRFYLAAGFSLGMVYWVKQSVAALMLPVFLIYAFIAWTFRKDWLWTILGALLMLLLNMALMWQIAGDPFHLFRVMAGGTWEGTQTSPGYYLYYLFLNVRHTWLMPFLAVVGLWQWMHQRREQVDDTGYVVLWGFGLLLILSVAVTSVVPLRLIFKQTNYMLIFAAPLALLAGYGLAGMKGTPLAFLLFVLISGSLVLSALEQQAIRVFTANSRAAILFQAAHPMVPVYGTSNAYSLSSAVSALEGQWPPQPRILPLTALITATSSSALTEPAKANRDPAAYAILDMETIGWRSDELNITPADVPSCWQNTGVLEPQGFGAGKAVLSVLRDAAQAFLPETMAQKALSATDTLVKPRPAYVYAIPTGCKSPLKNG